MLSVKNIVKDYSLGKANVVHVLKGLNIDFREHEFVSVLGPSGCGKTTLLNIIGGLDTCSSGEIVVDGVSTSDYSASDWDNYRNKKIGFVFQAYNLIPHLNVVRNVEIPLIMAGVKKAECRKRAVDVLKTVGLEEQIYKKPLQLSGGQMQRVALARALVTNPDIILADEPTGALDNESSVVVMDLLKKVADDRLVIMVTHNDLLAEKYSTRIINLDGGVVYGDSNPFVPSEPGSDAEAVAETETVPSDENVTNEAVETETVTADETVEPVTADETVEPVTADETAEKGEEKATDKPKAKKKKSKLSFLTAIELSFRNLISKKVRTALTSFAGSIGIIGILLVLAFSQGVGGYIEGLEEGSLSMYPITVEQTQLDYLSMIQKLQTGGVDDRESYPDTDEIYTKVVVGGLLKDFLTKLSAKNDLKSFKSYLEENFDETLGYVKYDYGVKINAYAHDPKDDTSYMKTEPFTDVMKSTLEKMGIVSNSMIEMMMPFTENMSSWGELMDNQKLLESSYELIGSSKWPSTEIYEDPENPGKYIAEVMIFTDEKNQLNDYFLFMLGLVSESDLGVVLSGDTDLLNQTYSLEKLLSLEYFVLAQTDYYDKQEGDETWKQTVQTEKSVEFVNSRYSLKAKVVGVARPKKGANAVMMGSPLGYHSSLSTWLMNYINNSEIVKEQRNAATYDANGKLVQSRNVVTGQPIYYASNQNEALSDLGVTDMSTPKRIRIYANSFENKQKITQFIDEYNLSVGGEKSAKAIKYSDSLSSIMNFVNTISDIITKALIGFSSVSLVVSSIMIAVIIYTSVLERRKEVGILRSVGARKGDVVTIFMSESGMLGLFAGLIGAFIAWLITIPINVFIANETGIQYLANLTWYHALAMILVSFGLSMVAGIIPAFIGAKQDPAVSLRTE